jgi:glycosyltransferase involved in cell wall biosynthesis
MRLTTASKRAAFFSICSKNYIYFARVWAKSVAAYHPNVDVYLFLADRSEGNIDPSTEPFQLIEASELAIPNFKSFCFRHEVMEFNTAIKPYCFSYLMARGYQNVVYMDPDTCLYAPLNDVLARLDEGAPTVLTPHALIPNERAEPPNDFTFLRSGVYNLGFLALRDTATVRDLVSWWERRLALYCVADRLHEGLFVDQKWIDLWPAYCPGTVILSHPGYNVAYWNLDERKLRMRDGRVVVNNSPLVFIHYSGIEPGNKSLLSKHQTRLTPKDLGDAIVLFEQYHDELDRHGRDICQRWRYAYDTFSNGAKIATIVRRFYRECLEPYDGDPYLTLLPVLNSPANINPNPNGVVTRLSYYLWQLRADLKQAFDLKDSSSQIQYSHWFVDTAQREMGVPDCLIVPVKKRLQELASHTHSAGQPVLSRTLASWAARKAFRAAVGSVPHARPLYRFINPARRRAILTSLVKAGWREVPDQSFQPAGNGPRASPPSQVAVSPPSALRGGVSIIGYPFGELGVGEALRSLARSTIAGSIPTEIYNFDTHLRARQKDRSVQHLVTNQLTRKVNVLCINADMLEASIAEIGKAAFDGRYNIVRPFWELSHIHRSWIPTLKTMDEIWAPTKFVGKAFSESVDRPVVHIPVAVDLAVPKNPSRARFGLPLKKFLFLFSFDPASYSKRKNPDAVIDAFLGAFGAGDDANVGLVIKTMGVSADHKDVVRLRRLTGTDRRIYLINETLDRRDSIEVVAACDAYVSLHRSEGFGFGLAEAMLLGKPVIGTGYSGVSDFLNDQTGFPIRHQLITVHEHDYAHYQAGQVWADPDIDHASNTMLAIYDDQVHAREIGRAARHFMLENHSPAAVGRLIRSRLIELGFLKHDASDEMEQVIP